MLIEIIRDEEFQTKTLGKLFLDGKYFGEVLEDKDRFLENNPDAKVKGATAIPRGTYKVITSVSRRFGRLMPEVLDVPGFTGVRIHGGNDEHDTEGCPLLGQIRLSNNVVANCKGINERLLLVLQAAEQRGEDVWLRVS